MDDSPSVESNIVAAIRSVAKRLTAAEWNKNSLAATDDGSPVEMFSPQATRLCVHGIVVRELWPILSTVTFLEVTRALHQAARELSGQNHISVFEFNDDPKTTVREIRNLLMVASQIFERRQHKNPSREAAA